MFFGALCFSERFVSLFFGAVCLFVFRSGLSLCFSERFVSSFFGAVCLFVFRSGLCLLCLSSRSSLGPRGDRPRARFKASTHHEAPTPALTTKTLVPTTANRRSTEDRSNAESTDLQNCGEEGRLCRPRSPVSTQRVDIPPEQPSWILGSRLLRFSVVTLGRTVGLQDCSGKTCSLSPNSFTDSKSCLLSQGTRKSLSHSRRPCEQWECPCRQY